MTIKEFVEKYKVDINIEVKTMSVWVVWRGCYTDRSIGKIFSDVKKAEDYANELGRNGSAIGEDVYIEEWSVE